MNRIKKFLDKFEIDYKKYGDLEEDAIDIKINDVILTLSAFDNELEVCCFVETNIETNKTISDGFMTYDTVIDIVLKQIINKR